MRALLNAVKTGFAEIWAHRMRSVLSFLAIAAGSVVFIDAFSAIFATYERLERQKEVSGMARLKITQNYSQTYAATDDYVPPPNIAYEDVLSLRQKMPDFYMISPEVRDWHNVLEYDGKRMVTSVTGVTPEWVKRDFVYTLKGRFLNWADMENNLRVCVLMRKSPPPPTNGFYKSMMKKWDFTNSYDTMVEHNDLLGKTLKIDGFTFTVVGLLEELPYSKRPSTILGSSQDYKILAPLTTLTHYNFVSPTQSVDVNVDTGDERTFEESIRKIKNFLKIRFGDDEYFIIENQLDLIRERIGDSIKSSLVTISLGMLAFIAGGIGIMNVTLATVFARTKEIGIRRAIGASRGDIMLQFIVEAVMLGLIGGVLGSAIGYLWGVPVKVMIGMDASHIKPWMPLVSVFIAVLTAFVFNKRARVRSGDRGVGRNQLAGGKARRVVALERRHALASDVHAVSGAVAERVGQGSELIGHVGERGVVSGGDFGELDAGQTRRIPPGGVGILRDGGVSFAHPGGAGAGIKLEERGRRGAGFSGENGNSKKTADAEEKRRGG